MPRLSKRWDLATEARDYPRHEFTARFVARKTATRAGRELVDGMQVRQFGAGWTYAYAGVQQTRGPVSADSLFDMIRRTPLNEYVRQAEDLRAYALTDRRRPRRPRRHDRRRRSAQEVAESIRHTRRLQAEYANALELARDRGLPPPPEPPELRRMRAATRRAATRERAAKAPAARQARTLRLLSRLYATKRAHLERERSYRKELRAAEKREQSCTTRELKRIASLGKKAADSRERAARANAAIVDITRRVPGLNIERLVSAPQFSRHRRVRRSAEREKWDCAAEFRAYRDATRPNTPMHFLTHAVHCGVATKSPGARIPRELEERMSRALHNGEPVWMVVDELVLRLKQSRLPKSWEEQARTASRLYYTRRSRHRPRRRGRA